MRIIFLFGFSFFFLLSCGGNKEGQQKVDNQVNEKAVSTPANDEIAEEEIYESGMTKEQVETAKAILSQVNNDYKKVDAAALYKTYCTLCHGRNGKLNLNNAKDLSLSRANLEERVAQIYHGAGVMTPYKGILSDKEIVALGYYIAEFRD